LDGLVRTKAAGGFLESPQTAARPIVMATPRGAPEVGKMVRVLRANPEVAALLHGAFGAGAGAAANVSIRMASRSR
jgi:hypothetical protein